MIAYLRGKVKRFKWGFLILDVGGVGYKINIDPQLKIDDDIVDTQKTLELFIHQHIREDIDDLYGFLQFQDLETFSRLISVNGVGPKAGMSIMACDESKKIYDAIENEDIAFFCSVPGIGKKVAAKIILDLKSKISVESAGNIAGGAESSDIIEALLSLGYKKIDINKIIHKVPTELKTDQEKIRWAMKNLSGQ